jgi:hypothetical protein
MLIWPRLAVRLRYGWRKSADLRRSNREPLTVRGVTPNISGSAKRQAMVLRTRRFGVSGRGRVVRTALRSLPGRCWAENDENKLSPPVSKFPRCAGTQSLPENETQVERADVNQLPFRNIFAAA